MPSCSTSVSVSEFEIGDDVGQEVGAVRSRAAMAVFQLLLQHEREEAAGDVAADRLIQLVIDRPRLEQALGRAERRVPRSTTVCRRASPPAARDWHWSAARSRRRIFGPPRPWRGRWRGSRPGIGEETAIDPSDEALLALLQLRLQPATMAAGVSASFFISSRLRQTT